MMLGATDLFTFEYQYSLKSPQKPSKNLATKQKSPTK